VEQWLGLGLELGGADSPAAIAVVALVGCGQGSTDSPVALYVSAREWRIIMSAINHGTDVPANPGREVLMGYQYALHQHKKKLRAEKSELRKSQESNNASSRSCWNEYSETLDSSKEKH
jgi:hypothetical protein